MNNIPKIVSFDLDEDVVEKLTEKDFNISNYVLTENYKIKNPRGIDIVPSVVFESNMHECEIVIIDLNYKEYPIITKESSVIPENTGKYYVIRTPDKATLLDLKPFNLQRIPHKMFKSSIIKIYFCGKYYEEEYNKILRGENSYDNTITYSNYSHAKMTAENKSGSRIKIVNDEDIFSSILNKYLSSFKYECILHKNRAYMNNFYDLLTNEENEIISSMYKGPDGSIELYLPVTEKKSELLLDLLNQVFPRLRPEIFPEATELLWRDDKKNLLPGNESLIRAKINLKSEFEKNIQEIDLKIEENTKKYSYMLDILTETGDNLVSAVNQSLRFIGFDSKEEKEFLEEGELKEEDIRIDETDKHIVIECKGISGTSTDNECRQIQKIKNRRQRKRGKFDVYGLYIVNHQLHIEPSKRSNPPFQAVQIEDAKEEVGLLTTYELYKQLCAINKGYASKERTKEDMLKTGLVTFTLDNLVYIGEVSEVLKKGNVAIFNLNGESIDLGMTLVFNKKDEFKEAAIKSIELDDCEVNNANSGEVGVFVDIKLSKGMKIYKLLNKNDN